MVRTIKTDLPLNENAFRVEGISFEKVKAESVRKSQRGLNAFSVNRNARSFGDPPETISLLGFTIYDSHMPIEQIIQIASDSDIARFYFKNRGLAPAGYIKGMAVVYARVLCKLKAGNEAAIEMAKAKTQLENQDALSYYDQEFMDAGMSNDIAGVDTLRHLFVLLTGLGMRESSGRYCEGRDRAASNVEADTAEAGLFQASFNARAASPLSTTLFDEYSENSSGFVEIFREGVRCKQNDLENFGSGDGEKFQRLSKECPAFAVEFAAVTLRNMRQHFGPINRKEAQVRRECDVMLIAVQQAVETSNLCSAFT